jgi:hypothetical protein
MLLRESKKLTKNRRRTKKLVGSLALLSNDFLSLSPLFQQANCMMDRLVYAFWHFPPFLESASYRIYMGMKGSTPAASAS